MPSRISLAAVRTRTSSVPDAARAGLVVSSALITLFFTVSLTTLVLSALGGALLLLAAESPERSGGRAAGGMDEPDSMRTALGQYTTKLIALAVVGVIVIGLFQAVKYTLAFLTVVALAAAALSAETFLELVQRAQNRASSWLGLPEGAVEARVAGWVAWAAKGEGR